MSQSAAGSTEGRLVRLQAITGLLFGTFLVLHLANAAAAAAGQSAYDAVQILFRRYYQFPAVEILCSPGGSSSRDLLPCSATP